MLTSCSSSSNDPCAVFSNLRNKGKGKVKYINKLDHQMQEDP